MTNSTVIEILGINTTSSRVHAAYFGCHRRWVRSWEINKALEPSCVKSLQFPLIGLKIEVASNE
jgi:hypothetical protein